MRSDKEVGIRYLPMKASFDAWLAALRLLLLGEEFVPAELLDSLVKPSATSDLPCASISDAQQETPDPVRLVPNLTVRETEVLKLVSTGLPNKTLAEKLRLSEHTVKLHVHHIFGKLRVHNRASATNWYLSHRDNRDQLDGR